MLSTWSWDFKIMRTSCGLRAGIEPDYAWSRSSPTTADTGPRSSVPRGFPACRMAQVTSQQMGDPALTSSLPRRCAAEFLGTALLILFGPGAVVAAMTVGKQVDYAALGVIGLSFGLVVAIVIYTFGTTSGAHINPAVTVSLAATGRFPWREVGPYVAAQLVGSVFGGLLLVGTFGRIAVDHGNVGGVAFADGVHYPQAILVEAVATYLLLLAIMGTAVDRRPLRLGRTDHRAVRDGAGRGLRPADGGCGQSGPRAGSQRRRQPVRRLGRLEPVPRVRDRFAARGCGGSAEL